jgi:hypothetical protein
MSNQGSCFEALKTSQSNYSQTFIKRSPLGQRKGGFIREVTS